MVLRLTWALMEINISKVEATGAPIVLKSRSLNVLEILNSVL